MILFFNGPPGSGKDKACEFVTEKYGFNHLSFKEQLIIDTADHFAVSIEWFLNKYDDRSEKEKKQPELGNRSKREALIYVSETLIKPIRGLDYYGKIVAQKIEKDCNYCFSDGGFKEELLPVINIVGNNNILIIHLYRNNCSFSSDSRSYVHGIPQNGNSYSEPFFPVKTYQIQNNSTLDDFHKEIKTIIERENIFHEEKDFR